MKLPPILTAPTLAFLTMESLGIYSHNKGYSVPTPKPNKDSFIQHCPARKTIGVAYFFLNLSSIFLYLFYSIFLSLSFFLYLSFTLQLVTFDGVE